MADGRGGRDGWIVERIADEAELSPKGAIDIVSCGGVVEGMGGLRLVE